MIENILIKSYKFYFNSFIYILSNLNFLLRTLLPALNHSRDLIFISRCWLVLLFHTNLVLLILQYFCILLQCFLQYFRYAFTVLTVLSLILFIVLSFSYNINMNNTFSTVERGNQFEIRVLNKLREMNLTVSHTRWNIFYIH